MFGYVGDETEDVVSLTRSMATRWRHGTTCARMVLGGCAQNRVLTLQVLCTKGAFSAVLAGF